MTDTQSANNWLLAASSPASVVKPVADARHAALNRLRVMNRFRSERERSIDAQLVENSPGRSASPECLPGTLLRDAERQQRPEVPSPCTADIAQPRSAPSVQPLMIRGNAACSGDAVEATPAGCGSAARTTAPAASRSAPSCSATPTRAAASRPAATSCATTATRSAAPSRPPASPTTTAGAAAGPDDGNVNRAGQDYRH